MEQIQVETLIIGAGMSGLSCAKALAEAGHQVLVVDKARGSGGRLASKSLALSDGQQLVFDLGCAGFAAQTPMFLQQIQSWQHEGLIAPWRTLEGVVEYVGTPRNSILTRSMADQLTTQFSLRIERLDFQEGRWQAFAQVDGQLMPVIRAAQIVLATPAEQAAALLPPEHAFRSRVASVATLPQWVVAVVSDAIGTVPDEPALLSQSQVIRSIVCDSDKPGRTTLSGNKVWQIQLHTDWSAQHRDARPDDVFQAVLDELHRVSGLRPEISHQHVHRWLYSSGHSQLINDSQCLWDGAGRIGVCGDYFHHPELGSDGVRRLGVESAFLSGRALAARMGTSLHQSGKKL